MHIAYITYEYPPEIKGGIATYTLQIARLMKERNHEVEVFCASLKESQTSIEDGIIVHKVFANSVRDFLEKVVFVFENINLKSHFDLIESPESQADGILIKESFPEIPLVVRLHTPQFLVSKLNHAYFPFMGKVRFFLGALKRGKFNYWNRYKRNNDPAFKIISKAELITCPSYALRDFLSKVWRINKKRIEVIPNPFNPTNELLQIPLKTDSKTVTYLGRLAVIKGVIAFAQAIKFVLSKRLDVKFRFIGFDCASHIEGLSMKQFLKKELQKYEENVYFIDGIENSEVPVFLSQTDICVFPSLFESFSYTCLEVMGAGRAIIGSKAGAMKELLQDGAGLLVNPRRPKEIAKAINRLIDDSALRAEMGRKARNRVLREYACEDIAMKMEGVYFEAIRKGKG
jgi:glycosyltransferase involved in cell wall biosynthesis